MSGKDVIKETNKEKIKALEMAISQIEKNFGKGSIMRMGEGTVAEGIQAISTGSLTLDIATGIGRCESRIVPFLKPGAGVVTTRGHVHYLVTEYGVVDVKGKGLLERARALTGIAHPDHREAVERATPERFGRV